MLKVETRIEMGKSSPLPRHKHTQHNLKQQQQQVNQTVKKHEKYIITFAICRV